MPKKIVKKTVARRSKKKKPVKKTSGVNLFNHPLGTGSIKDFFIPHEGNNHQPKSLHPKRVLFHISAALMVKAVVLLLVFNYPLTAWMSPDVSAAEGRKIVNLTNNLRSSLSLSILTESSKLNQAAYKKVQDMFINQYFAHRSPAGLNLEYWARQGGYSNYAVIGENLAVGYDNADEVMSAWKRSPTHYSNLVDPNYREIGVSVAGGQYKEKNTVFIAQYFGSMQLIKDTPPAEPKTSIEKVVVPETQTVLSEQSTPKSTTSESPVKPKVVAKATSPVVSQSTKVVVSQPAGKPAEKVVQVKSELPSDTTAAVLEIFDQKIALEINPEGQWQGQDIITTDPDSSSVVPPALTVNDGAGNSTRSDVNAENIVPEQSTVLEQYSLYRGTPNYWLGKIFSVSSWYFQIILILAMISLILNIVIARHKQHPHLIASGLGLVVCMVFLIIF